MRRDACGVNITCMCIAVESGFWEDHLCRDACGVSMTCMCMAVESALQEDNIRISSVCEEITMDNIYFFVLGLPNWAGLG